MKFVVSSSQLLSHLQAVSRVISTKNTLPILDNYLFRLSAGQLEITASDLETTMITQMAIENHDGEGGIAVPAKILNDILKEFSEQPLTFDVKNETLSIDILSENGRFSIVGQEAEDFPQLPEPRKDRKNTAQLPAYALLAGISKTLFAAGDDELRPVMNGVFVELNKDSVNFVASDAHKLVRYKRLDASADKEASFILPKKPAGLLKNILAKEENQVSLEFDDKNAFFSTPKYRLVCRLIEGNYPAYNSVIPTNNPNKLIIDRVDFLTAIKRVAVFSNQSSNLVKLELTASQVTVSAQDIDFSISAFERLSCQYEGDNMDIGFKSTFLLEILANLAGSEVVLEMSDPSRAGILLPLEKENADEDVLMLLMPMMIN